MAAFLTPFDGSSVNIALPSIGNEFSMDAISLGWVATVYLLASAMFLVPLGRVADIYGRKKLFTLGVSPGGTGELLPSDSGSFLTGWPVSFTGLKLCRIVDRLTKF